jgi:hypothetical protein
MDQYTDPFQYIENTDGVWCIYDPVEKKFVKDKWSRFSWSTRHGAEYALKEGFKYRCKPQDVWDRLVIVRCAVTISK